MRTAVPALVGLLLMAGLLTSGCEVFHDHDGVVQIRTNQDAYVLDTTTVVRLTIRNGRDIRLHYNCGIGVFLEEWSGDRMTGEWYAYPAPECLAPGVIAPGSTRTIDLPFEPSFVLLSPFLDGIRLDSTVQYRFRPELFTREELPVDEFRSNAVTVIKR